MSRAGRLCGGVVECGGGSVFGREGRGGMLRRASEVGLEVPLRDGAVLRGLRWAAEGGSGGPGQPVAAPVVLLLTPYGAECYGADGGTFAGGGLHFVALDVRGRGASDGDFRPFVHDGDDGHDAVRWLTEQEWCSGEVVLYGGSYSGFTQWATAATRPPGLRAIAPVASVYPGIDFPMAHNISKAFSARWRALRRAPHDGPPREDAGSGLISAGRPYRDLDVAAVGRRLPAFQEWLDHPALDAYWAGLAPTRSQYERITVPVLTITGQYDDDQLGALTYYERHVRAAPPGTVARHLMVIGPWDHAATRSAARSFGGLTFAESSAIDLQALQLAWYRWVLGRGERPAFLGDRVTYFHVGEDRWRSAPKLPGGEDFLRLYPVAEAEAGPRGVPAYGLGTAPGAAEQVVPLLLDPGTAGSPERAEPSADRTFTDDRPFTAGGGGGAVRDAAVHISAPFSGPVDVSGRPSATLVLSSELPDFDLLVGVYLLPRDTGAPLRLLSEAAWRARYRASLHRADPWPAGRTVEVVMRDFSFTSLRIDEGDRVALVLRAPHRRWQPNQQAGGVTADETAKDAVAGVVRLHQGPSRPSFLSLPVSGSAEGRPDR
ncbi:CocE/NonD family hydrolase [Streptomyces sp. BBFR2]|uniref:CocE/NonD family hydrolase n=1 Tax=Streptomyces sp. BBFR2 TaxID=3372854 RepID=UPI0037D99A1A